MCGAGSNAAAGLRGFAEQVRDAAAWLRLYGRHASPARAVHSYAFKHLVQAWAGRYVSSAAVVAAAEGEGYHIVGAPGPDGGAWLAMAACRRPREPTAHA